MKSRSHSAEQLCKAFDLQLPQPSTMATSQHRANPLHNNQETRTLHFRESALHVGKHLPKGIKQAFRCLLKQAFHNACKSLSLEKGDFIFSAKCCISSSNWSPPSVPAESTQHTPISQIWGCLVNGIQHTRFWPILVISYCATDTRKNHNVSSSNPQRSPHILAPKQSPPETWKHASQHHQLWPVSWPSPLDLSSASCFLDVEQQV